MSTTKKNIYLELNEILFFQIYFETENGKDYNSLNSENWDNLKDTFFTQRMKKYKSNYTQIEKIKLELERLENLKINKTDTKVLKERYKEYLNQFIQPEAIPLNYNNSNTVKKIDYLTLLLDTYINQKDIFFEVIQNRQLDFEKNNSISKKEFYFNCDKVVKNLKSQIDEQFFKRQKELYQIIEFKEAKGELIINFENELKTLNNNQFGLNLLHLTADKFRGNFYLTDIDFIENSINKLKNIKTEIIDLSDNVATKKVKDYKECIWFKTGVKMATGEAYALYNKYKLDKGHFIKICLELGFKETDRPYFSDTINDNNSDKNTFANKDKLKKLHKHLTENGLTFGTEFLKKYNQIEPE